MQRVAVKTESQSIFAVDLDGTLIKTDLLVEKIVVLLRRKPLSILKMPFILFKGRLPFKKWLNSQVAIDYSSLPYREEVIERVKKARERGEKTILLSASLQPDVSQVNRVLGIFDEEIGSHTENLKGAKKLSFLRTIYPDSKLTYVGDSRADLRVWNESDKIVAVNPSWGLRRRIEKLNKSSEFLSDEQNLSLSLLKQLRVHQWAKNFLVFLPVFSAHRFSEWSPWLASLKAFAAFSFVASAVYVFNDICDVSYDRRQESKKKRPLASGALSPFMALSLIPICFTLSALFCWRLPISVTGVLVGYLAMNFIYSFWIKEWLALDVVFLSVFYTLRIFAGGLASNIAVSEWLLSFSVFFFFGLAMVKRYSELKNSIGKSEIRRIGRRAYQSEDLTVVLASGISTSLLSILILALYLNSVEVRKLYSHQNILWLLTPCMLFWLNRLWILGARGQVNEDPLVFAFKDKPTWVVMLAILAIILVAM